MQLERTAFPFTSYPLALSSLLLRHPRAGGDPDDSGSFAAQYIAQYS